MRENAFHVVALHVNDAHLHLLNNTPNTDSHLLRRDSMQHTTVRRHIIGAERTESPPTNRIKQHEKRCAAAPGDLQPLPAG